MSNVSAAAQDKVAAVRALLERMTVPCRGTNLEPDPAYDGLRELVTERCEHSVHTPWSSDPRDGPVDCPRTQTRDWTGSLSGSLYGAAVGRLPGEWCITNDGFELLFKRPDGFSDVVDIAMEEDDHDLAIMTAIEAALTAQLEVANAKP